MRFRSKLLFVALAILILTLLLSSLLSLASFDKIYSASLIATYEVSGKNLQRKIQSALRFGKPLAGIVAMDALLDEVREGDADIKRIDVVAPDKSLLYTTGGESRGDKSPYSAAYPDFADPSAPPVTTKLIKGRYVTFLPLRDRSRKLVGFINLEFPREVVYRRLRSMVWDNLHTLTPIIIGAVLVLILLIRNLVSLPIKRKVERLVASTAPSRADGEEPQRPATDAGNGVAGDELDKLYHAVAHVTEEARSDLRRQSEFESSRNALQADLASLGEAIHELAHRLPGSDGIDAGALLKGHDELSALLGTGQLTGGEPSSPSATGDR